MFKSTFINKQFLMRTLTTLTIKNVFKALAHEYIRNLIRFNLKNATHICRVNITAGYKLRQNYWSQHPQWWNCIAACEKKNPTSINWPRSHFFFRSLQSVLQQKHWHKQQIMSWNNLISSCEDLLHFCRSAQVSRLQSFIL